MTALLPSRQADQIRAGLLDYLTTTFALVDPDARRALTDFLTEASTGIFKGPYLRLRLPFRPADPGWERLVSFELPYPPYRHQAQAFARLASRAPDGSPRRPEATLVTTGTGSGKTEAFLLPILDHVLRARRAGQPGIKALILYPMNALANDQAGRLATLLTTRPELAGISAGLFTGQSEQNRTVVSAEGLVTDRAVLRASPPDILLTNYKMLDQLLLRREDQPLWQASATSLQFVVLDEFHTYDGAQGTDVAMLLRRLGLALKAFWPSDPATLAAAGLTDADRDRPLGRITPVATSATLGDKGDPRVMLDFATTIFGETFDASTVVGETRLTPVEWAGQAPARLAAAGLAPLAFADLEHEELIDALDAAADAAALADILFPALFDIDPDRLADHLAAHNLTLGDLAKSHPAIAGLAGALADARPLDEVADLLFADAHLDPEQSRTLVVHLAAALSHLRATEGRDALSVDLHLWVRELSRIDRIASATAGYVWSDDGTGQTGTVSESSFDARPALPAIYCRHCGRSGWGVELAPVGQDLNTDDTAIRANHAARRGRFRALLFAPGEADRAGQAGTGPDGDLTNLAWLHVRQRMVLSKPPAPQDPDLLDGWVLPVVTHLGTDADDLSARDQCPSCQQRDGIRFLGSAIATMLSVTLSTLFGDPQVDSSEKKSLVFIDSVQDAAHRAGFVEARSHSLTMRAVLRAAVGDTPRSVDEIVEQVMTQAGDDPFRRYRILPPALATTKKFETFWQAERMRAVPPGLRKDVRRRVAFDTILEVGLMSRVGRTLETTAAVAIGVDAGTPARLAALARRVLTDGAGHELLDAGLLTAEDTDLVRWVRGTLERMRERGAIEHEWFTKYLTEDGNRYWLWAGRPRSQGMPAFPPGRSTPAFPRVGPSTGAKDPLLDAVTSAPSWYTQWAMRTLGIPAHLAGVLARRLLDALASEAILTSYTTKTGVAYAIPASAIVVYPTSEEDLRAGRHLLACDTCRNQVPVTVETYDQLVFGPCTLGRCPGRLAPMPQGDNFYRRLYASSDMRRIVAREHSSLLDDQTRLRYEAQFRSEQAGTEAPNVLVATPTLEMGIDIGDLSTVILASLPRTVASYLQRIGRAGRRTGNALSLAFVTGRGEFLPRLGDPLSIINGQVRPPATYLSAQEILRRQYVAAQVDSFARDPDRPHPRKAAGAIATSNRGSFLGDLIAVAHAEAPQRLDSFLAAFPGLDPEAARELRHWATPSADDTSGLSKHLESASARWNKAVNALKYQLRAVEEMLPRLQATADLPAAGDDDRAAATSARGTQRLLRAQLQALRSEHWIGVLEEYGVLPNYTLLDDSVTLDVALTWIDSDTGDFESEEYDYQRPSANALREFAPGATFYARGMQVEVDTVDLGPDGQDVRDWALCPCCGYAQEFHSAQQAPTLCPRCHSGEIADAKQRVKALELARVSAQSRRDEATISDGRDERIRPFSPIVVAADIDPAAVTRQWFATGYDFGVKYLGSLDVRWFNTGKPAGSGAKLVIAGNESPAAGFRLCAACGHRSSGSGTNNPREHRPWCVHRSGAQEHSVDLLLMRSLRTQGLVIRLPHAVTAADSFAEPSLAAALMLGIRECWGGSPEHIGVSLIADPMPATGGPGGRTARALLLHDAVPGGTGYLAGLADPDAMWQIVSTAWRLLHECPCAHESRLACHRCLLPFAGNRPDTISRAVAERHLRDILHAGRHGDQDPDPTGAWAVTEVEPTGGADASPLEIRLRALMIERLTGLGATVKEIPGPQGTSLAITIPGGRRRWSLEPEVALGGVRPDFILRCEDPQIPRVAIFTDGHRYHASTTHNIIAADARKRAALREQGYAVLAVTHADLAASADPAGGHRSASAVENHLAPFWLAPATVAELMAADFAFPPTAVDAARGGPLGFLMAWIQQHDVTGTRQLADALPWFFAPMSEQCLLDPDLPLEMVAAQMLSGQDAAQGSALGWRWIDGPLALLARARGVEPGANVEVAVVLDDRAESVADPEHRAAWQRWLHLSNAVNLRTQSTVVTAVSEVDLGARPSVHTLSSPEATTDLSDEWRAILAEEASELSLSASERGVLLALEAAGVPVPEIGQERADGIPVFASWPDARIALEIDLEPDDLAELARAGWTVVPLDAQELRAVLKES